MASRSHQRTLSQEPLLSRRGQFPACGQQPFPLGMAWDGTGELCGDTGFGEGYQKCCISLARGNSFWVIHVFLLGREQSLPPSSTQNLRENQQNTSQG